MRTDVGAEVSSTALAPEGAALGHTQGTARWSRAHTGALAALWLGAAAAAWLAHHGLGLWLRPASVSQWAWVLLCAPVLEETVFRWLVQASVHDWQHQRQAQAQTAQPISPLGAGLWDRILCRHAVTPGHGAAALATLAFSASHAPAYGWLCLWWLLPGWALAEVWRRSRSLAACIATHAWFNLCLALSSQGV